MLELSPPVLIVRLCDFFDSVPTSPIDNFHMVAKMRSLTVAESMPLHVCCYYGHLTVHVLWFVKEFKHDKHVVLVFSDHGQLGFYSPYITHQAQVVQKLGNAIHQINDCYPVERYYENRLHYPLDYFIQ